MLHRVPTISLTRFTAPPAYHALRIISKHGRHRAEGIRKQKQKHVLGRELWPRGEPSEAGMEQWVSRSTLARHIVRLFTWDF